MARPEKKQADYFPHFVKSGRTVFVLERNFGNDGYAFWFKLLELLSDSEGFSYDCSNPANWSYLLARTLCTAERAETIIAELIALGKIDRELWKGQRIIWVQRLVDNLAPIFQRRKTAAPDKPGENAADEGLMQRKPDETEVSGNENAQRREKERKGEKRKGDISFIPPYIDIVTAWNSICGDTLPKVVKMSDTRRAKIKTRVAEWGCKDAEEALDRARVLFTRIRASGFLCGDSGDWAASFDWLFDNPGNWVKVAEGNYDNRGHRAGQHPQNAAGAAMMMLGPGEYIEQATGRRTYGTGAATIPADAPARPSERYSWNASTRQWTLGL